MISSFTMEKYALLARVALNEVRGVGRFAFNCSRDAKNYCSKFLTFLKLSPKIFLVDVVFVISGSGCLK